MWFAAGFVLKSIHALIKHNFLNMIMCLQLFDSPIFPRWSSDRMLIQKQTTTFQLIFNQVNCKAQQDPTFPDPLQKHLHVPTLIYMLPHAKRTTRRTNNQQLSTHDLQKLRSQLTPFVRVHEDIIRPPTFQATSLCRFTHSWHWKNFCNINRVFARCYNQNLWFFLFHTCGGNPIRPFWMICQSPSLISVSCLLLFKVVCALHWNNHARSDCSIWCASAFFSLWKNNSSFSKSITLLKLLNNSLEKSNGVLAPRPGKTAACTTILLVPITMGIFATSVEVITYPHSRTETHWLPQNTSQSYPYISACPPSPWAYTPRSGSCDKPCPGLRVHLMLQVPQHSQKSLEKEPASPPH